MKVVRLTESDLNALIENIIQEQNELNEDTVLFRKMTLKSKFNFGKYINHTVEDVLRLGHTMWLRNVYYTIEGITFTDDILEKIGVFGDNYDYRIKKPGKDHDLGQKVNDIKISLSSPLYQKEVQNYKIGKLVQHLKTDKTAYAKKNLQRWNQGHK